MAAESALFICCEVWGAGAFEARQAKCGFLPFDSPSARSGQASARLCRSARNDTFQE